MKYLDLAVQAIETMMRKYDAPALPPVGHFHYHQGVFLSGVYQNYLLCGDERYFTYIKDWIDSVIDEKGNILLYDHADLDDIMPGILLFPLYKKTGGEKYKNCLHNNIRQVEDIPVCDCGGFYHKVSTPHQMWLDGLYMVCPFMAEYAACFDRPEYLEDAVREIKLMREKTRDSATKLWYHAYDESKTAEWCDKKTGRSSEFWGRSLGWVPIAILDVMEKLPEGSPYKDDLEEIVVELLNALLTFQGKDGRWFQVVNKIDEPGNWPENSCSSLYAAAVARSVKAGLLSPEKLDAAKKAFDGIAASLRTENGDLQIGEVCIGTCVGDYEYYVNRPCSANDLHGVGAFLLMCAALEDACSL